MSTSRRRFIKGASVVGGAALAGCLQNNPHKQAPDTGDQAGEKAPAKTPDVDRVAADPTNLPSPVDWSSPRTHEVTLETEEVIAEIEPGVTFRYMTFGGQVPGPMIRVREGDTVNLTLKNLPDSVAAHNVDLHAVYGTGGGNLATDANPGKSNAMSFRAEYPGAFIYHCAVPTLDHHISSGMFGMILVEPEDGLPEVDKELYFGQSEIYTDRPAGEQGHHAFDMEAMAREDPTYVVLNGEKAAITPDRYGPAQVQKGETIRVFMVDGGPNLPSYFHPIGNVWSECWPQGAVASDPLEYVQTQTVPPGSCVVADLETPVPETIKLVDHALSRVVRKGLLAEIEVTGEEEPEIFDPNPS